MGPWVDKEVKRILQFSLRDELRPEGSKTVRAGRRHAPLLGANKRFYDLSSGGLSDSSLEGFRGSSVLTFVMGQKLDPDI
jgi:hypothetical protein